MKTDLPGVRRESQHWCQEILRVMNWSLLIGGWKIQLESGPICSYFGERQEKGNKAENLTDGFPQLQQGEQSTVEAASAWLEEAEMWPAQIRVAPSPLLRWVLSLGDCCLLVWNVGLGISAAACICTNSLNAKSIRQLCLRRAWVYKDIFSTTDELGTLGNVEDALIIFWHVLRDVWEVGRTSLLIVVTVLEGQSGW